MTGLRSAPGRPRWMGIGIALAALALIVVVATVFTRSRPGPTPEAAPAPIRSDLPRAPDIEIVMYQGAATVGGEKVRLSQLLAKGKPVVLNYFAGLCPPCRAEMPDLQKLYDEGARDNVTLISVDIGPYVGLGSRDEGKALLKELKIAFPAGTVFDDGLVNAYQILGMPTTFFILPDGRVLRKHVGLLTPEQMRRFTAELVQTSRKQ